MAHEFRGTGRRSLTIVVCVNDTETSNIWSDGDTITGNFEIVVQYVRKNSEIFLLENRIFGLMPTGS